LIVMTHFCPMAMSMLVFVCVHYLIETKSQVYRNCLSSVNDYLADAIQSGSFNLPSALRAFQVSTYLFSSSN
jgi:hypothetical protein